MMEDGMISMDSLLVLERVRQVTLLFLACLASKSAPTSLVIQMLSITDPSEIRPGWSGKSGTKRYCTNS
jgi:hypothetical protein